MAEYAELERRLLLNQLQAINLRRLALLDTIHGVAEAVPRSVQAPWLPRILDMMLTTVLSSCRYDQPRAASWRWRMRCRTARASWAVRPSCLARPTPWTPSLTVCFNICAYGVGAGWC